MAEKPLGCSIGVEQRGFSHVPSFSQPSCGRFREKLDNMPWFLSKQEENTDLLTLQ